jgi:hypothetical protein
VESYYSHVVKTIMVKTNVEDLPVFEQSLLVLGLLIQVVMLVVSVCCLISFFVDLDYAGSWEIMGYQIGLGVVTAVAESVKDTSPEALLTALFVKAFVLYFFSEVLFAPGWLPTDFYCTAFYYWSALAFKLSVFLLIYLSAVVADLANQKLCGYNSSIRYLSGISLILFGVFITFLYNWEVDVQQYIAVSSDSKANEKSSLSNSSNTTYLFWGLVLASAYAYVLVFQIRKIGERLRQSDREVLDDHNTAQTLFVEIPMNAAPATYQAVSMGIDI